MLFLEYEVTQFKLSVIFVFCEHFIATKLVKIENISKKYGQQVAVDNLSFDLSIGEIVGFIGVNGAGKSTTMKILAGILKPDAGRLSIFGHDPMINPLKAKKYVGFLPEDNPLYETMYVKEYLEYVAKIYSPKGAIGDTLDKIIQKTSLEKEYRKKIFKLSKGNRQRVGLAQALIHDPSFLILDEPTSGLDPHQQHEIGELITAIAKSKIILFSTHILQEVDSICSRVIIIDRGHIIHNGQVSKKERVEDLFFELTKK